MTKDSSTDTARIIRYYNKFNEEHRLTTRHGLVEFTTTMHFIQREIARQAGLSEEGDRLALQTIPAAAPAGSATNAAPTAAQACPAATGFPAPAGSPAKSSPPTAGASTVHPLKIADIGAGTGRYAVALSRQGHTVTAVELVPKNLAVLEAKHEKINLWPGDARNLHFLPDESFDITLLLGPLYHLHSRKDRLQALGEAKRITKKGGTIFAAYVMNEYSVLTYCFRQQHISEVLERGQLTSDWHTIPDKDGLYSYLRLEDINELAAEANLQRRLIFAADGAADYLRRELNALSEEDFSHFLDYHLATCLRPELLGASSHTVDVLAR